MEVRQLRYLLMIAEEGNFTRAAEKVSRGGPRAPQSEILGFPLVFISGAKIIYVINI
jgi:hypothetical protein